MGLDPNNLTFQAIYHRLLDVVMAHITLTNAVALAGAIFYLIAYTKRTIVPLRSFGIVANTLFVGYGLLANSMITFFQYLFLLPINSARLYQMLKLVKKARVSVEQDLTLEWLQPYMAQRKLKKGDIIFRKGDKANEMFVAVSGKFRVKELDIELRPGVLFGEIGFLSSSKTRTQTVDCVESGHVLTITYDSLLELIFTNPEFGYYFLCLTSNRLLQNIANLERIIEQNKYVMVRNDTQKGQREDPQSVRRQHS